MLSANQPTPHRSAPSATPETLIPVREVQRQSGLSRSSIYGGVKAGTFPPPAKIGRASRWLQTEVAGWIAARAAART